jgi:hypothetical protein
MKRTTGAAAAVALLTAMPAAAQNDCPGARDDYGRAVERVSETLRLYGRCIAGSGGRNDCALEFKQLEKAQKAFDEAVMQIGFRCRPERQGKFGDPE